MAVDGSSTGSAVGAEGGGAVVIVVVIEVPAVARWSLAATSASCWLMGFREGPWGALFVPTDSAPLATSANVLHMPHVLHALLV
eukprot:9153288-Pyramimonas_sp.AAC.1